MCQISASVTVNVLSVSNQAPQFDVAIGYTTSIVEVSLTSVVGFRYTK